MAETQGRRPSPHRRGRGFLERRPLELVLCFFNYNSLGHTPPPTPAL